MLSHNCFFPRALVTKNIYLQEVGWDLFKAGPVASLFFLLDKDNLFGELDLHLFFIATKIYANYIFLKNLWPQNIFLGSSEWKN